MHFNCLESERTNDAFPCSRRKSKYLLPDLVVLFDRKITRCVPILMSTRHSPIWRRLWQPGHGYIFAHPISRRSSSSDLGTKNNRRRKALVNLIKIGIMPRCPALFRAFIFNSSNPLDFFCTLLKVGSVGESTELLLHCLRQHYFHVSKEHNGPGKRADTNQTAPG